MATLETAEASITLPEPSSSAERSVREVASRLGIPNVEHVVQQMKQEYVLTDWQLSALDSFQWKSMGAPIGLAVAVHQIIQQDQQLQQQQGQQKMPYVLPSDAEIEAAQESEMSQDQHNDVMDSAILGIHNSTNDEEEKEGSADGAAEENDCTVVDAAIRETSKVDNESEYDEKCQNFESIVTDASVPDASSNEGNYLTEQSLPGTDDKLSSTESDPDEADVTEEKRQGISIEGTISIDSSSPPPPQQPEVHDIDPNTTDADFKTKSPSSENGSDTAVVGQGITVADTNTMESSPPPFQEPEVFDVIINATDDDTNTNRSSPRNDSDKVVGLADTPDFAPDEGNTLSHQNPLEELMVAEESVPDVASNNESLLAQSLLVDDDDGSVDPQNGTDAPSDVEPETLVVFEESSKDHVVLDKSPSEESSETWDADADVDTIPTTSMSEEESSIQYKQRPPEEVSTTPLSAPLPHDECDDSFHASPQKELLLTAMSFDSEDISEDLVSFASNNGDAVDAQENDAGENKEQLEP
ncbi:MAG: hypothetical protein SGBAC_011892, partial [Bacillariaceae sp.]